MWQTTETQGSTAGPKITDFGAYGQVLVLSYNSTPIWVVPPVELQKVLFGIGAPKLLSRRADLRAFSVHVDLNDIFQTLRIIAIVFLGLHLFTLGSLC